MLTCKKYRDCSCKDNWDILLPIHRDISKSHYLTRNHNNYKMHSLKQEYTYFNWFYCTIMLISILLVVCELLNFTSIRAMFHTRTVACAIVTFKMTLEQAIKVSFLTSIHTSVPFAIARKKARMSKFRIWTLVWQRHTCILYRNTHIKINWTLAKSIRRQFCE